MKKYIKNILILSFITLLVISCKKVDFGDANVDPNNPTENLTNALLTNALFVTGGASTAITPGYYVQHYSDIQYTDGSRYGTSEFSYEAFYTGTLHNLERIISLNSNESTKDEVSVYGSNANQIATAKLVKAYTYHQMTDRWGYIPFSQALKSGEFDFPKFDSSASIYNELFNLIDEALAQISTSENGPTGDIIFNGNMDRWKQFGHTLKLIMALRLADVSDEMTSISGINDYAKTKFTEAVSGAISDQVEDILFPYTQDDATDNPWQDRYNGNRAPDFTVSKTLIDFLQNTDRNDPRVSKFADEVENAPGTYVGMEYAVVSPNVDRQDISLLTSNIANKGDAPGYVFTYAQVAFAKAEAVLKGWISGDTSVYYYEGIKASMKQWGVTDVDYDTYITQPAVVWNSSRGLELIAEQKWIALFMQPFEAWAEWRRLDFPTLTPAASPINGTNIPVRYGYSSTINDSNRSELEKAIQAQGLPQLDDLSTKLFWDVK
ncbi:SusD/RagB family nutrient-binding outer membrane lipoprotein [Tenacibaculum caenipelagi]|uniref:SusD-like starch-binding protein associating with outer membrane n=1 Tax=Tenacibaculum caenipelagi TaxID=1325435 RepID=A0A4R6T9Z6_9FLAO|nr:SusD/RagB family nutrient-binding outer membrane lipoprotein [Tenacibaculum caenipelagi]TDQ22856.1 SusD-like starch-binding protein associating with outer membrane [Tenacibaculum caenipelagi]